MLATMVTKRARPCGRPSDVRVSSRVQPPRAGVTRDVSMPLWMVTILRAGTPSPINSWPHGLGVGDDDVRQAEGAALDEPLCGCLRPRRLTPPRLAPRGDAYGDARERRARHAEDVGVEVVSLHDLDAAFAHVAREATELRGHAPVVETRQREARDVEAERLGLDAQRPAGVEAGEVNVVAPALGKQTRDLHGLPLAAALVKAADELEDVSVSSGTSGREHRQRLAPAQRRRDRPATATTLPSALPLVLCSHDSRTIDVPELVRSPAAPAAPPPADRAPRPHESSRAAPRASRADESATDARQRPADPALHGDAEAALSSVGHTRADVPARQLAQHGLESSHRAGARRRAARRRTPTAPDRGTASALRARGASSRRPPSSDTRRRSACGGRTSETPSAACRADSLRPFGCRAARRPRPPRRSPSIPCRL